MMNIIKTAIITIIISFISGLLLDYYKNLAPKILCNVKNSILRKDGKKIIAYIITVSNVSKKTIHELTLNVQNHDNNINITDAQITRGLKFDSSIEDNVLDVYIPFLSKNDKFSVTVYTENQQKMHIKPAVVLRSPQKFKQIDSLKQTGMLAPLLNIPENINESFSKTSEKPKTTVSNEKDDFTMVMDNPLYTEKSINKKTKKAPSKKNSLNNNKKLIIAVISVVLLASLVVLEKSSLKNMFTNIKLPDTKTESPKESTNDQDSSKKANKNTNSKTPAKSSDSKASTQERTKSDGNTSNSEKTENKNVTTPSQGSNGNATTQTQTPPKETNKEAPSEDTKGAADTKQTAPSQDSKVNTPTETSDQNTDSKATTKN